MSNVLGSAAGLSNMAVAMTFASLLTIIEQSATAVITESRKERLQSLMGDGKAPKNFKIDDSANAYLQGIRSFCLVCLFGILFTAVQTPFVSGQRILATKELSYALVAISVIAFFMSRYVLGIPFGLTKGERATRTGMIYILMAFQLMSVFLVYSGGNISTA